MPKRKWSVAPNYHTSLSPEELEEKKLDMDGLCASANAKMKESLEKLKSVLPEGNAEIKRAKDRTWISVNIRKMFLEAFRAELIKRIDPNTDEDPLDVNPWSRYEVGREYDYVREERGYLGLVKYISAMLIEPSTREEMLKKLETTEGLFTFDDDLNVSSVLVPALPGFGPAKDSADENDKAGLETDRQDPDAFIDEEVEEEEPEVKISLTKEKLLEKVHDEISSNIEGLGNCLYDEDDELKMNRIEVGFYLRLLLENSMRLELINRSDPDKKEFPLGIDPWDSATIEDKCSEFLKKQNYEDIISKIAIVLYYCTSKKDAMSKLDPPENIFIFDENFKVSTPLTPSKPELDEDILFQESEEVVENEKNYQQIHQEIEEHLSRLKKNADLQSEQNKNLLISLGNGIAEPDGQEIVLEQPADEADSEKSSAEAGTLFEDDRKNAQITEEIRKLAKELGKTDSMLSKDSKEYKELKDALNDFDKHPCANALQTIYGNAATYMEKRMYNKKLSSRQQKRLAVINKILNVRDEEKLTQAFKESPLIGEDHNQFHFNDAHIEFGKRVAEEVLQELATRLQEYPDKEVNGNNRHRNGVKLQTDREQHNNKLAGIMKDPAFIGVIVNCTRSEMEAKEINAKLIDKAHNLYLKKKLEAEKTAKSQPAADKKLQAQSEPVQNAAIENLI